MFIFLHNIRCKVCEQCECKHRGVSGPDKALITRVVKVDLCMLVLLKQTTGVLDFCLCGILNAFRPELHCVESVESK